MLKYEFIDSLVIFELIQKCSNKQRQEVHKLIKDKMYLDNLDDNYQLD